MENHFEVDIEQEKVQYEGEWIGRQELADKIKKMIDSQDFKIGIVGSALEYLQQALANAKEFSVKLTEYNAEILQKHAERAGLAVPSFIRQAIQAYLARLTWRPNRRWRQARVKTQLKNRLKTCS